MVEPLKTVDAAQTSQFDSPWSGPVTAFVASSGNFAGNSSASGRRSRPMLGGFFGCAPLMPGSTARLLFDQRARVAIPWNLTMHDRACLGDRANAYSLGEIEIGSRAVVAQEVYLSTGTHNFSVPTMPLTVAKITIGEDALLGARVFVMPGVSIGARAIVGACSVVTRDVPEDTIAAGNPCRPLRPRLSGD